LNESAKVNLFAGKNILIEEIIVNPFVFSKCVERKQ